MKEKIKRQLTDQEKIIYNKQITRIKDELEFFRYELKRLIEDRNIGLRFTIRRKEKELDQAIRQKEQEIRDLEGNLLQLKYHMENGITEKRKK